MYDRHCAGTWNKLSLHNDANIIAIPGRFIEFDIAVDMVKVFFTTDFEGGRHKKRIIKIPFEI